MLSPTSGQYSLQAGRDNVGVPDTFPPSRGAVNEGAGRVIAKCQKHVVSTEMRGFDFEEIARNRGECMPCKSGVSCSLVQVCSGV